MVMLWLLAQAYREFIFLLYLCDIVQY